jgi:hypothetical protein
MDAQVDDRLGDSITYEINGVPVVGATTAFLLDYADDGGGMGLGGTVAPLGHRWQLKIKKSLLPERPSLKHIVTAAKLDGPYRPAANNLIDGGDYWIVDLQKAPV